jgi:hypothetical protein
MESLATDPAQGSQTPKPPPEPANGANRLTEKKRESVFLKFLDVHRVHNTRPYRRDRRCGALANGSFSRHNGDIVLNGVIGFMQEAKAER